MTNIILKEKNVERIQKVLDEVQDRARVRMLDATDVLKIANKLDKKILPFTHKKYLKGTIVSVDVFAENFPDCYRGVPYSTIVELKHNGTDWLLTNVGRCRTRCENKAVVIQYSDDAKMDILKNMSTMVW